MAVRSARPVHHAELLSSRQPRSSAPYSGETAKRSIAGVAVISVGVGRSVHGQSECAIRLARAVTGNGDGVIEAVG
jgi:hypothetical protein